MENDGKQIYRKWWFWAIAIVVLIIIFFCIYMINNNSTFNNYKNQSISILNDYKKGKITREEAKEKIEAISDKLQSERKVNEDTNIFYVEVKLS